MAFICFYFKKCFLKLIKLIEKLILFCKGGRLFIKLSVSGISYLKFSTALFIKKTKILTLINVFSFNDIKLSTNLKFLYIFKFKTV